MDKAWEKMEIRKYSAKYIDKNGEIPIELISDGLSLEFLVKEVTFKGRMLFDFEVINYSDIDNLKKFDFYYDGTTNCLSNFNLVFNVPIIISDNKNHEYNSQININVFIDDNCINNYVPKCKIALNYNNEIYEVSGFEYGLIDEKKDINRNKLPKGLYVKSCINCVYSTYSPYGNFEFGDLLCFKEDKEWFRENGYGGLKGESPDFWKFRVQEIYCCNEFEKS